MKSIVSITIRLVHGANELKSHFFMELIPRLQNVLKLNSLPHCADVVVCRLFKVITMPKMNAKFALKKLHSQLFDQENIGKKFHSCTMLLLIDIFQWDFIQLGIQQWRYLHFLHYTWNAKFTSLRKPFMNQKMITFGIFCQ